MRLAKGYRHFWFATGPKEVRFGLEDKSFCLFGDDLFPSPYLCLIGKFLIFKFADIRVPDVEEKK